MKIDNSEDWWFSGIYDPPSVSSRGLFWNELVGLSEICGSNWCLGGDFNVVRNTRGKRNSLSNTHSIGLLMSSLERWSFKTLRLLTLSSHGQTSENTQYVVD